MNAPLVSVLTTVYNREPYLAACIESVLAQTLDDFELIVVDDGSSDRSLAIAQRYAADARVRVYANPRNLGDYPNRNRAASLARGRYLKYVDADDIMYPHCLALMVEALDALPEAGYGISRHLPGRMAPALLAPAEAYRDHFFGTGIFACGPLDAIIRRTAFEAVGGFSPARYTSDTDFFLRIGARYPGALIVPGLVWWRRHDQQESVAETRSPERVLEVTLRRQRITWQALSDAACPLSAAEIARLRAAMRRGLIRLALGHVARGRWHLAGPALRELRTIGSARAGGAASALPPNHPALNASCRPAPGAVQGLERTAPPLMKSRSGPPRVSVLIPARNAEATLERALHSVLQQRFTDWELVLVDDASDDATFAIAQRYADGERIRCYRNDRPLGEWPTHNRCAELARGDYLKFLGAGDAVYPHGLALSMHMMQQFPEVALGIAAPSGPFLSGVVLDSVRAIESEFLSTPRFTTGPTGLICRSQAFQDSGGFQADFKPVARHFAIRMASRYPILLLPDGLVFENSSDGGAISESAQSLGRADGFRWLCDYLQSSECPLDKNQRQQAIENLQQICAKAVFLRLRGWQWSRAWRLIRETGINLVDLRRRTAQWNRASDDFYALALNYRVQAPQANRFIRLD